MRRVPSIPLSRALKRYAVAFMLAAVLIVFVWPHMVRIGLWVGGGILFYFATWALMTTYGTRPDHAGIRYRRRVEQRLRRREAILERL